MLKAIFGSGDIVKQGVELIDSLHTSGEERIEAQTSAQIRLLQSYEPYKLAQRLLMLMFATTFVFMFALVLGMTLFYGAGEARIDEVRAVLDEFWIGEIMLTIVAFYFGGGATEGVVSRMRHKKGDEPTH